MSQTVKEILAQIDALTPEEQGELAYAFLCSFEPSPEVTSAWEVEVTRRLQEVRTKKEQGIPAKDLFAELRQKMHMNGEHLLITPNDERISHLRR